MARSPPTPQLKPGFTLVELMVAMVIMLIIAVGTIEIAANVFQSNTQSIHMVQLSQEMRSAIQIISRDIRRSGYNDDSLASFLATENISSGLTLGDLDIYENADCLQVQYDGLDGVATNVVYRLRVISDIGRVSAHFDNSTTCDTATDADGWIDISDPLLTDISALSFFLDDQLTDIAENMSTGNMIQVGVEQVSITISATLRGNNGITRSITNAVQIRNQFLRV